MKLAQKIAVNYVRARLNMLAVFSKKHAAKAAFKLFCTPNDKSRKKTPAAFERAEKLSFSLDNKKIVGYRWNHPKSKKFLILHGFESTAINFDRYVSPMARKGYEVMAFDAPAHGLSEGKQVTVLQYRKMIEDIYEKYGPIDAFMGHSFGGLAASLALENIPHTKQTKLVLIAPATETNTAINSFFRFVQLNEGVRIEFENLITELGGQPVQWYSIARALKKIEASILWIHDEDDHVTPLKDVQPIIQTNFSNIQFYITRGWGHSRIYRENKVVRAVTEFL